ncbi:MULTISPECIES: hypothetical protein [unclassified Streptomyces]|uniref:hypothetical protein n=1 Tax=unclassified Streptomyces TaxID=2593676 RepID=UPI0038125CE1
MNLRRKAVRAVSAVALGVFGLGGGLVAASPSVDGPLTVHELMRVLPRTKDVPGYRVDMQRPNTTFGSIDQPCTPLGDVLWSPFPETWTARARAAAIPVGVVGGRSWWAVELTSYSEEEATAFMADLAGAVPRCVRFEGMPHYEEWPRKFTLRPAAAPEQAGDEVISFVIGGGGPGGEDSLRYTVVRVGGVMAVYAGEVPGHLYAELRRKLERKTG